ncbi:MAG: hypothetical protein ACK5K7_06600 [Bacilli bacterium]
MNEIIEEKLDKFGKIIMVLYWIGFITVFIVNFVILIDPNIESSNKGFSLFFNIMIILPLLIFGKILSKSVTMLTADRKCLTIKLLWRKPLNIPLKNIKRIDTFGDVGTNRHIFIIKSKEINFNTSIFAFSFNRERLNIFMKELQFRVDKAKQECKNQN